MHGHFLFGPKWYFCLKLELSAHLYLIGFVHVGIPLILLGLKNGSVVARSRNSMAGIFRIDSSIARRGGINAIYDMRFFRSFVVITDDGHLISWTVAEGLRDSA